MTNRFLVQNLFGIEGLDIAWYGAIIAFGIIIGVWLAGREAERQGIKGEMIFDFLIIVLPLAIIGARAYYVIFEWANYVDNPMRIFAIREGGLAIYGGVIGGFIGALIFAKINRFPLLRLTDMVVPSLILGQAIGRWGNFVNQEAFGNLVTNPNLQFFPYAVFIERLGEWHQATFFYESMWNLCIFAVLIYFRKRTKFTGQLLATYFMGYGLGRFWIEGLRTDSLYLIPGLRASQALSLILIIVGILMFVFRKKLFKEHLEYEGKYQMDRSPN
ncbi:MAG TPA: prolipoprotein diacylglyceryl transferase [Desulfitobacterium dehalogenans]|uniref:Phosphatidylglycerol--prolipoprotein diacylglyceryl transferase n=1 Tax=Desulfitobacterium dehalogenans TaxID=36854 RepID=A0A7C6Z3W7_9FIRM|nr:prolipoprotein diacylglyceryl transferase [Desulfitobacterium dehalogenans]